MILLTVLIQCSTVAFSAVPEDSVKTYLWGLIKITQDNELKYEDGYFLDQLLHPREFSEPITFLPLEIGYGISVNGGGGEDLGRSKTGWIRFEENPPNSYDGGHIGNRIGHQLEIDFLKMNLSHYLLKSSWADIQSGLFLRYSTIFFPASLSGTGWDDINPSWVVTGKTFSPRVLTYGMSHSWIFQRSKNWFLSFKYTYGVAFAKFYHNKDTIQYDATPSGWGPATSYSGGFRWIFDPGMKNRYAIGIDFKHVYTKIDRIKDKQNLTPISRFDLNNFGLFFTIDVFYGGRKTSGDFGKEYYYHRDYISAVEKFRNFIHNYPTHTNRYKAEEYIQKAMPKIPHQLLREGMSFDERNLIEKALDRYLRARVIATDPGMTSSLNIRIDQIADKQIYDAELLLEKGLCREALSVMQRVSTYSEKGRKELPRFQAQVYLRDGEIALEAKFFKKALHLFAKALSQDPDLALEIGVLQHQIAVGLVAQANQITDPEAIRLAIESLEMAKQLSSEFRESDYQILLKLKEKLNKTEAVKQQSKILKKMDKTRDDLEMLRGPRVEIGMTIPEVEWILGEPRDKIHQQNVEGQDRQLWLYDIDGDKQLQITFLDFIVIRVETK